MTENHERRIRALERALADLRSAGRPLATPEAWTAPTLLNSWANFGSGYSIAGYYRDPWGRVHLRGLVKDGTITTGTPILTLPAGYRPAYEEIYPVVSGEAFGQVRVQTDGDVCIFVGVSSYLSLDGISFRAA